MYQDDFEREQKWEMKINCFARIPDQRYLQFAGLTMISCKQVSSKIFGGRREAVYTAPSGSSLPRRRGKETENDRRESWGRTAPVTSTSSARPEHLLAQRCCSTCLCAKTFANENLHWLKCRTGQWTCQLCKKDWNRTLRVHYSNEQYVLDRKRGHTSMASLQIWLLSLKPITLTNNAKDMLRQDIGIWNHK